jgi:hypothetical protein
MQKIIITFICWGAVMGFTSFSFASWTDNDTPENRAIVKAKFDKIQAEISTLEDHPWAGLYYQGDGLGTNLTLAVAPKAGFAYTWRGCMGLYGQNYGEIIEEDGQLTFSFALENEEDVTGGIPEKFLPVSWGERLYLIPPNEMIEFCNEMNSRREPRDEAFGFYFLRDKDWEKEVQGQPKIPEQFKPYLLKKPVTAVLTSIIKTETDLKKYYDKRVTVKINKGKKDGLLTGMKLHVIPKTLLEGSYNEITLTKVDETQSEGIYEYNSKEDRKSVV